MRVILVSGNADVIRGEREDGGEEKGRGDDSYVNGLRRFSFVKVYNQNKNCICRLLRRKKKKTCSCILCYEGDGAVWFL